MLGALAALLLSADPPSLATARSELAALRFEPALLAAASTLQAGGAAPEATAELHFIMGQAASVLGRGDEAQASFARALELQPGLTLPPGVSPRIVEPYRAAQRQLAGARLSAGPSTEPAGPGLVRIRVQLDGDVMGLYSKAVVVHGFPAARVSTPLAATSPLEAVITCVAPPCGYVITVLDLRGNALLVAGSEAQPLYTSAPVAAAVAAVEPVPTPVPVAVTEPVVVEESRPFFSRPAPYFVAAGVLAAAASVFAWRFTVAESRVGLIEADKANYPYADILAADTERQVWLGATIASAALAAVLAAVGFVVW